MDGAGAPSLWGVCAHSKFLGAHGTPEVTEGSCPLVWGPKGIAVEAMAPHSLPFSRKQGTVCDTERGASF